VHVGTESQPHARARQTLHRRSPAGPPTGSWSASPPCRVGGKKTLCTDGRAGRPFRPVRRRTDFPSRAHPQADRARAAPAPSTRAGTPRTVVPMRSAERATGRQAPAAPGEPTAATISAPVASTTSTAPIAPTTPMALAAWVTPTARPAPVAWVAPVALLWPGRRSAWGARWWRVVTVGSGRVPVMESVESSSPLGGSAHSLWKTLWTTTGTTGGRRRGQAVDNPGNACGGTKWSLGTSPRRVDIHCANPQRYPQDLHRPIRPLTCENVSYPQYPQPLLPQLKRDLSRKIKNESTRGCGQRLKIANCRLLCYFVGSE
jgi:hypothetical protein